MINDIRYVPTSIALRTSGWLQDGRQYEAPVRPDRVLWVSPKEITRKPVTKPSSTGPPPSLVVGGNWDRELNSLQDDIVYRAFHRRFVQDRDWEETGYVDFLRSDVSEHGSKTKAEAKERCEYLDELYEYINRNGYKSQTELERNGSLIDGISETIRPPAFREISVDVTRDGELVWHGGIHRLVLAQLIEVDKIPVRINTRHEQWQATREAAYERNECSEYGDHPDVEYLLD